MYLRRLTLKPSLPAAHALSLCVQNPERVVEGFTEEFEEGFMELLRRSHPHSRVAAKIVYNDYISDPCAPPSPTGLKYKLD